MFSRRFKPVLYACAALAGVILAVGVTGASASLVWNGDFDTGTLSQYNETYCYQAYSCTVVPAPGGRSGSAGRFELASGEASPIGAAHAQIQQNSNERAGDESWWHWEVFLPADFRDSTSFYQVITEWHHYALGGGACNCPSSPPLTFQEINGRYVVRIVNSPDSAQGNYWTQFDLGAAPRGAWTSFDMHAKWSNDPNAAVTDVYVNGALTQHITGHPNVYTGYLDYFLAGWYRATDSQAQAIYLDNVRRGNSLADVQQQPSTTSATSPTSSSSTTTTAPAPTPATTTAATTTSTTTTTPPPPTTTAPGPTTTTSAAPATTTTSSLSASTYADKITSPSPSSSLIGRVMWTAQTSGGTTSEVDFFVDGIQKWTEYWPPYVFGGDDQFFDTAGLKNGSHTLMARAISSTGQVATASIAVTVNNIRKGANRA